MPRLTVTVTRDGHLRDTCSALLHATRPSHHLTACHFVPVAVIVRHDTSGGCPRGTCSCAHALLPCLAPCLAAKRAALRRPTTQHPGQPVDRLT